MHSRLPFIQIIGILLLVHPSVTLGLEQAHEFSTEEIDILLQAVGQGEEKIIEQYLAKGMVNVASSSGETPLHVSGIRGSVDVVSLLLDAGANVDARTWGAKSLAMTPLTWFVYGNHIDASKLLLNAGANVNAVVYREDGSKLTPLDIAGITGNNVMGQLLIDYGGIKYVDCSSNPTKPCEEPPTSSKPQLQEL